MIASLLLFCGSRAGHDPAHTEMAAAFGTLLGERGVRLVYGGGGIGLMGIAASACLAAGGAVVGVIPRSLMTAEIAQSGLSEMIVTETLHERKAVMHARADAIIALPGGIGTLDELFETLTWRELGLHDKPVWLLGSNHYWRPFRDLLTHLQAQGFAPPNLARLFEPLDDLQGLAARL